MLRGAIFGLTATAIWGGLYVVADVVLLTIPPFTLLSIRLILGSITLAIILWLKSGLPRPSLRAGLRLLAVGLVGFGISVGLQFVGTDKSTAVNGALITSASPAFILVFAALILREKLTLKHVGAVALATLGVLVIVNPLEASLSSDTFIGDLALMVAAITWGLYSVLVRQVSHQFDTLLVTLFALLGGLILALPAALVELAFRPIGAIGWGIVAGVLYLGVISTAGAMWLWNRAFALVEASIAALFFFAQPVVGALLGVTLLGQRMTLGLWVGSALIAAGILIALVIARPSEPDANQSIQTGITIT